MNPFQDRYDACNGGTNASKYAELPDFPCIIDVELTSSCNFRCLMCPTGNRSLKRPAVLMTDKTLLAIIDQCVEHDTALRFIGWGEPTLHPVLVPALRQARGLLTHINTNGSKITPEFAFDLVEAGLSSIKFSFQGVDAESYEEMRQIRFFEGMLKAIKVMRSARGDRALPYIAASTSITYETPKMVEDFRARLGPLVDRLSIGHTTFDFMDMSAVRLRPGQRAMLERLKGLSSDAKQHPSPCPEVFQKLSIQADGSVVLCCNDFDGTVNLGNVNAIPLSDLWRHPKIEAYRKRLVRDDYDAPLCRDCYDYMDLTG